MNRNRLSRSIIGCQVVVVLCTISCGAQADPPERFVVEYRIHKTPGDPESGVKFIVTLDLHSVSKDGSTVAWEIVEIEFRDPGEGGAGDTVWSVYAPASSELPDDLWWVEHDDPDDPQASEFADVPALWGTAEPETPGAADLDYEFEGDYFEAEPPANPPYSQTGLLTAYLIRKGADDPDAEVDDEPVEIEKEND
jgi:hypothetical protein